jgi:hypothetical protein
MDPGVADVQTQRGRSVLLKPLNLGATNLVFIDDRDMAIANAISVICDAGAI